MRHTSARKSTRREFLRRSALAGTGIWLGTRSWASSPNEKLNVAFVGVGGRGAGNLRSVSDQDIVNVVALCDVDSKTLGKAAERFPEAETHADYRALLDQKGIDAVVVSTPDHTHGVISIATMQSGRHVYCEKPLAHNVYEVERMLETAAATRRVTQMGIQMHATDNYRRVVELIQAGAIGRVRECHAWVQKTWSGGERPTEGEPVPASLSYDLWLGPAAARPYHSIYLPANWRRWWDFGGGTLADMGCHFLDVVHWALDLTVPVRVETEGPAVHSETTPTWLIAHFDHPARGSLPPVRVTWYDGGKKPDIIERKKEEIGEGFYRNGVLFVGEAGMLVTNYGEHRLLGDAAGTRHTPPPTHIPASIGHHREWLEACRSGAPTSCDFSYGGLLSETCLLGNVAYRSGKAIHWDRAAMRTDSSEADAFLRRTYREGWSF